MSESVSPVADKVNELLEPVIASIGVDLVDVEWAGGTLRVVVDQQEGVSTETLAEVSRLVSPVLDQHDPITSRYMLEVTSPGVERPLRRLAHFQRAVGEQVVVKLHPGSDPRRFRGELSEVTDEGITVVATEVDGNALAEPEVHRIAFDEIDKARTVFDWGPTPKTGGKNPGGKKR